MSHAQEDSKKKRKPGFWIRIGVAGLAALGIGAAITTAAWTDRVYFSAEGQAAGFNLQGSTTAAGPWDEYETVGDALVIPLVSSNFDDLIPNEDTRTLDVYVLNDSTVDAFITVSAAGDGALFAAGSTVTTSAVSNVDAIPAGEVATITVSVTPGDLPASFQTAVGTILVTVEGSTE